MPPDNEAWRLGNRSDQTQKSGRANQRDSIKKNLSLDEIIRE